MATIKIYWLRFWSATPKALQKIQIFLGVLLVPISGALGVMSQYGIDMPVLHKIFVNALITIPFMITILQFATSKKDIQELK